MGKQGSCLEKEIKQGTMPGARTHARKATHGLGGQHQDVDRNPRGRVSQNDTDRGPKWRKYIHGVANARIEDS